MYLYVVEKNGEICIRYFCNTYICALYFIIKNNEAINGIKDYIERDQMVLILLKSFGSFVCFW